MNNKKYKIRNIIKGFLWGGLLGLIFYAPFYVFYVILDIVFYGLGWDILTIISYPITQIVCLIVHDYGCENGLIMIITGPISFIIYGALIGALKSYNK